MIETIAYRAIDGKLFKSKKECTKYEEELKNKRACEYLINQVDILDRNFKNISNDFDMCNPTESAHIIIRNTAKYVRFKNLTIDDIAKMLIYLNNYFGLKFSIMIDEYYYYDIDSQQFQGLSYKIDTLKDDLKEYEEIKRKLEEKTNE